MSVLGRTSSRKIPQSHFMCWEPEVFKEQESGFDFEVFHLLTDALGGSLKLLGHNSLTFKVTLKYLSLKVNVKMKKCL